MARSPTGDLMLICLAVDHRHADVSTRERFHLSEDRLAQLYSTPRSAGVGELAVLATCNRTEVYACATGDDPLAVERATRLLARRWVPSFEGRKLLLTTLRRRTSGDAARHLLRVAAGLESQVLGDGQILGQLRAAYRRASEAGTAGSGLHRLFETALRTGKRVQAETSLSTGHTSVGSEAAALAARRFGQLHNARVVVVGCGKTGARAARQLVKLGARDVVLLNRTQGRAAELAAAVGGRAAPLETVHGELALADVAIVATGAEEPIVRAAALGRARENCGTGSYPLLLIDLAMPRNVEPVAATLPQVTVVDLDTLHPPVVAAEEKRCLAVPAAEAIVDEELRDYTEWLAAAAARVAVRPLRDLLTTVCRREVAHAAGESVAERTADRIVAKLLARPMLALREAIARGEAVDDLALALDQLFAEPSRTAAARVSAAVDGD